jgi:hypothetical protein
MLTCEKCGAKGFIALEGDEFHCVLCGLVWYARKRDAGRVGIQAGHGGAPADGADLEPEREGHP